MAMMQLYTNSFTATLLIAISPLLGASSLIQHLVGSPYYAKCKSVMDTADDKHLLSFHVVFLVLIKSRKLLQQCRLLWKKLAGATVTQFRAVFLNLCQTAAW